MRGTGCWSESGHCIQQRVVQEIHSGNRDAHRGGNHLPVSSGECGGRTVHVGTKGLGMMEMYRLRKASWEDRALLYTWRNDSSTRKQCFSSEEILMEEHEAWLREKLVDSTSSIYILEIKGKPAGQVRLDRSGGTGYISYSISGFFRGHGYGKLLLRLLENEVAKESLILVGQVKKDNTASQIIFQSLGYEEREKEEFFEYRKTACNVLLKQTDVASGGGNPTHQ